MFDQQVIDREEFRQILVQGEVLPAANETDETKEEEVTEEPKREGATSEQVDKLINALIKDGN